MTCEPVKIWRATCKRTNTEYWLELFQWKGESSSTLAHQLPEAMANWQPTGAILEDMQLAKLDPVALSIGKYWKKMVPKAIERINLFLNRWYGSFVACTLLTLALMHRFVFPLNAILVTRGIEGEDCGQMIWNLWTVCESITHGHNPYTTNLVYYPIGANLGFHTLAAGFFPVTAIVKLFVAGDPMYPIYAYRIIVLLSFTLILFFSFQFLRQAGFSLLGSAISATGYAFCDFYIEHSIHLNHLAGFFIPLTALCLLRFYQQPSRLRLLLLAGVAAVSVYFTEFSVYILLAILVFLSLIFTTAQTERKKLLERLSTTRPRWFIEAGLLFLVVIAPFLFSIHGLIPLKPKPFELSLYSANLAGFFIPDPRQAPLYGEVFGSLWSHITAGMGEPGVFVGFPFIVFSILALIKFRTRLVLVTAASAAVFFLLSLGPSLKVFEYDSGFPMPYSILARIPPFDIGRTPVRFIVIGMFFTSILTAFGVSWLQRLLSSRRGGPGAVVLALVFVWTVAEVYTPVAPQRGFKPPSEISAVITGPVLNLPLRRNDGYAALLQIFHHQPIVTGFLARYTAEQQAEYAQVERLILKGGTVFCDGIRTMGIRNVIITPNDIAPDAPSYIPLELGKCNLNVVDLRENSKSATTVSNLTNGDNQPSTYHSLNFGERVDALSVTSEPFLWYGWSTLEPGFRWSNGGQAAIRFSLSRIQNMTFDVAFQPFLAPGRVDAQHVQIKLNDQLIATFEANDGNEHVYHVRLPPEVLRQKNVLTFIFPDAESPAHLNLSEDSRLLGINLHWFELSAIDSAKPN